MKTFAGLFLSSATFGLSIAIVYWFSSREIAGTFLLGFMMIAFFWVAGYSYIAERASNLAGDRDIDPAAAAGEDVGIFTKSTPWPFFLAVGILLVLLGVVWSDFLLFTGIGVMLLCLWRLGAESARTGKKRVETKEGPENVS